MRTFSLLSFAASALAIATVTSCVSTKTVKPFPSTAAANGAPYHLFTPAAGAATGKRPLVVALHGCLQTGEALEQMTGLDSEGDRAGFYVLYPEQKKNRNPINCWNWFDPANQKSGSGEPEEIVSLIRDVVAKNNIDPSKIYVAGLSSGGALASTLLACYPKVFAGGALIAAPSYGVAVSDKEAQLSIGEPPNRKKLHRQACQPTSFRGPVLITTGTKDRTVHPQHAAMLAEQYATQAERQNHYFATLRLNNPGDLQTQMVCYGKPARVCRLTVAELDHAWSGGGLAPYSDPHGPSTSEMIRRFLIERESPTRDAAQE